MTQSNTENPINQEALQRAIEIVKTRIPQIESYISLKKVTNTESQSTCIFCGGVDRSRHHIDGKYKGRIICRKCGFSGDILDIYMKKNGINSTIEVIKQFAPEWLDQLFDQQQPVNNNLAASTTKKNVARQEEKAFDPSTDPDVKKNRAIYNKYCLPQFKPDAIIDLFCNHRGIPEEYIRPKIEAGLFRWKEKHGDQSNPDECIDVLVVPFHSLPGKEHVAQQYFTPDNTYFPGTTSKRKSSAAIGKGFYFDGAPIDGPRTKNLLITESVINALSLLPYVDTERTCIIAIASSSEATKKAEMLKPWLQNIEKVISCGDNDKAGNDMNNKIAKALVDVLPVQALGWKPDDPSDINDLQQEGKGERIRELISNPIEITIKDDANNLSKSGQPERIKGMIQGAISVSADPGSNSTWETPISLDCQTAENVPDYLLPGVLGEMAIEISKASETPIELSTALLLAVVATACHGKFKIESVPGSHTEPVNIWFLVVLDPGNRKSSVLKDCTSPLSVWEKAQRVAMEESTKSAKSKRARQEVRLKTLRTQYGKANKEDLPGIEADIIELEETLEEIPEPPQLWTQDATAEHSATLANHNNERISVFSAEGGIFENLAGRYSNGVSNLDFYLQGHAGDPVRVDRGSREPVHLDNPCVTLGLAVQEDVLKGLGSKPGFKGRGFNDRILYFVPKSNLGYRTLEPVSINREVSERYSNLIDRLLNIKEPPEHEGKKQPYVLKPSKESYREWHSFSKSIESKMRKGEELSESTGWASKLPGAAARIAALLHCSIHVEDSINISIELDTMKRALHLSAILTKHALIAFNKMGEDGRLNQARKLWGWIEKNRKKEFKKKDCFDALRGSFPRVTDLDEPLKILQERNYVLEENKSTGGRPSKIIHVNPELTKGW